MKKLLLICVICLSANILNAQITIIDDDVKEKVVSKPKAFDSLSNITYQRDPVQYKKYIGYKLYCLPVSKKYKCKYMDCAIRWQEFRYKTPREYVLPHKPFEQTDAAKVFDNSMNLRVGGIVRYKENKEKYEKKFIVHTDIYNAVPKDSMFSDMYASFFQDYAENKMYTPYESIQNTYFTILNIEVASGIDANKGHFSALEDWDNEYNNVPYLRFTLKNESTGEELYWIHRADMGYYRMFLVPYFEKLQKTYKGQKVVATAEFEKIADINTGEPVNIHQGEIWQCYEVAFVHLTDEHHVHPCFFLEKDGAKVMIKLDKFTEKKPGIFSKEDNIWRPAFMLEKDFNEIVAERNRTAEEKQRLEEERKRKDEQARMARNKQIMQKYGDKYGKLICEGKVCLNMTKEMCIEAWGEPMYVNSAIVNGLIHEQWVYGWDTYLYFNNGVLKSIHE